MATNRVVGNCNDGGSGSLRATVASALDGDSVDLSQLACSTITLTSGAILIDVGVNNLTLTAGPGAYSAVTIDGGFSSGHHNRVLSHLGSGTLTIKGLKITDAKYNSGPSFEGGCILSAGNVSLIASTVSNCTVLGGAADGNSVFGGGIYAAGSVSLLASTVSNNVAQATGANNGTRGGGIYSRSGNVSAAYSIIANNSAVAAKTQGAYCGGICLHGNLDIGYSTISGNHAQVDGGIRLTTLVSRTAVISNSTISGNSSSDNFLGSGGVYINGASLTLSNSTIAFNTANSNYAGGLQAYLASTQLQSSIIADNTAGGVASDLVSSLPVTGANNLIFHSSASVPADTLLGVCPRLLPLADNGGGILTHALRDTSPAIDKGNNALALTYDERGQGFARVFGSSSDIGAYEWHGGLADRVFNSGFEVGCQE